MCSDRLCSDYSYQQAPSIKPVFDIPAAIHKRLIFVLKVYIISFELLFFSTAPLPCLAFLSVDFLPITMSFQIREWRTAKHAVTSVDHSLRSLRISIQSLGYASFCGTFPSLMIKRFEVQRARKEFKNPPILLTADKTYLFQRWPSFHLFIFS